MADHRYYTSIDESPMGHFVTDIVNHFDSNKTLRFELLSKAMAYGANPLQNSEVRKSFPTGQLNFVVSAVIPREKAIVLLQCFQLLVERLEGDRGVVPISDLCHDLSLQCLRNEWSISHAVRANIHEIIRVLEISVNMFNCQLVSTWINKIYCDRRWTISTMGEQSKEEIATEMSGIENACYNSGRKIAGQASSFYEAVMAAGEPWTELFYFDDRMITQLAVKRRDPSYELDVHAFLAAETLSEPDEDPGRYVQAESGLFIPARLA